METDTIILTQKHYDELNFKVFSLGKDLKLVTERFEQEAKRNQEVEHRLEGDLEKAHRLNENQAFTIDRLLGEVQTLGAQVAQLNLSLRSAREYAESWARQNTELRDTAQVAPAKPFSSQAEEKARFYAEADPRRLVAKFRRVMAKFPDSRVGEDVVAGGDEIMTSGEIKEVLDLLP